MNVVFAADYVAQSPGAFITSLKYLAERLINNGNRVAFLFSEDRDYLNELKQFGTVFICRKTTNRKFSIESIFNLMRACKKIDADLVHIQFIGLAYLFAAITLKIFLRYKLIVHWRCIPEGAIKDDLYHKFTPLLYKIFSYIFIDTHIAISKTIKEILIKRNFSPSKKIHIIYNGIDANEFLNSDHKETQTLIEQLAGRKIFSKSIVGMIADYSVEKDHEMFIKAAELVLKKNNNVIFLLIGSERKYFGTGMKGRFAKMIETLNLQKSVVLIDNCPYATRIISGFDIGVLCSHYEGFGNVLIEYMMAGKPVIATDVGGIAEIIQDGITGYLVPPKEYVELADKILFLLKNSELKTRMGANARRIAKDRFSLSSWVNNMCALYNSFSI
ncbi:MAG: glycosyltransferase family 4 protein [candidate division WOR-3 bacterium]